MLIDFMYLFEKEEKYFEQIVLDNLMLLRS